MPTFYAPYPRVRSVHTRMVLFLSFLLLSAGTYAQNVAVNSGLWSDVNTWSLSHTPQPGETVSIQSGVSVTADINATVDFIQINNGSSGATATLTINPGVTITVNGD